MTYIIYRDDKTYDCFPGCWITDDTLVNKKEELKTVLKLNKRCLLIAYCVDDHGCGPMNTGYKPTWYTK